LVAAGSVVAGVATSGRWSARAQDLLAPSGQQAPGSGSLYFAATGHNLASPFRDRWEGAGGEAVLGAPISEERYVSGAGGVLQSFEGLTLLYDPTQEMPFDVRGNELPPETVATLAPAGALRPVTGCDGTETICTFFAETGHTLGGEFATAWEAWGGQAILGLPISEPFFAPRTDLDQDAPNELVTGSSRLTQIFQAAVMESVGGAVRLRPLGLDLATADGLIDGDPAFRPAPPTGGTTFLVAADDGLRLREAPNQDASMVALLPGNAEFIAAADGNGEWIPGYADGFSGWVSASYLASPTPLPPLDLSDWNPEVWQGAALGQTNIRLEPTTTARVVKELAFGDPVTVTAWVAGEEVFEAADLWAKVGEGRFVYARNVGRNAPVLPLPPPIDAPLEGRWIDIDLIQQLMTAYEGRTAVRTVVVTTGMAGWETPPGWYQILNRVPNETMTSGAIGAENHYKLEDVLFTQYFTDLGHALHFAWWRTEETIGRPGSHGCVNLLLDDARFFWDWATFGTPILIHP